VRPLQEPFIEELKKPEAFVKDWSHLMSAQYDYDTVEARMQFFSGSLVKPLTWQVMIGKSPSRVVGTYNKGFVYRYYEKPDNSGYLGEMHELQRAKP
jgi:hypothetical protein